MACALGIEQDCNECRMCGKEKDRKKMTNFELIKEMNVEELAEFIHELNEHCLAGMGLCDCSGEKYCSDICKSKTKEWLESECDVNC